MNLQFITCTESKVKINLQNQTQNCNKEPKGYKYFIHVSISLVTEEFMLFRYSEYVWQHKPMLITSRKRHIFFIVLPL